MARTPVLQKRRIGGSSSPVLDVKFGGKAAYILTSPDGAADPPLDTKTIMEIFDVAIVGGGPAGSTCGAFCAKAGLRTIVIERENFPREKVCGDCLNPACWTVLRHLELAEQVRLLPHGELDAVEFIAIGGAKVRLDLPRDENAEIAIKRSLFDELLLDRARQLGAEVLDGTIVSTIEKMRWGDWKIDVVKDVVRAHVLVAADGRNSTVARLRNLLPRPEKERVALQSHIPLPPNFGNRVVLQFLPEGYSGQAPVNDHQLNLCLVARARDIERLKSWAMREFAIAPDHSWRTVTPLTRQALKPGHDNLLLIGDAARVVEPFTGEGIYYALRSGELAARAIGSMLKTEDREHAVREFSRDHAQMYRGRLWINQLARSAVLSPRIASFFVHLAKVQPGILNLLTRKIVSSVSTTTVGRL
jgi:menaquinone-9 beta-reductase